MQPFFVRQHLASTVRPFMATRPAYSIRSRALRPALMTQSNTWLPLCFQQLPTIKFRNPFILITMQNARRVGYLDAQSPVFRIFFHPYALNPFVSHSSKNCRGVGVFFPLWNFQER